jgi:DNA-directed RNA polymerase subunit RPC12/RpoP
MAAKKHYRCFRCGQQVFFFDDRIDRNTGKMLRCNKDKSEHACYVGTTKLRRDKQWFLESVRDSALRSGIK